MTAYEPVSAVKTSRSLPTRQEVRPAMPDPQLWKTDKARAFEAAVRWFLAVSRSA